MSAMISNRNALYQEFFHEVRIALMCVFLVIVALLKQNTASSDPITETGAYHLSPWLCPSKEKPLGSGLRYAA
jgi:hypothetical protein